MECMDELGKKVNSAFDGDVGRESEIENVMMIGSYTTCRPKERELKDPPITKTIGRKKGQRQKPGSEKKKRRCGKCGKSGHTKPTCKAWLLDRKVIWYTILPFIVHDGQMDRVYTKIMFIFVQENMKSTKRKRGPVHNASPTSDTKSDEE
jgi:hypothetical protein